MRISASALQLAIEAAEQYIARLAREAGGAAQEAKRKTIMDADIQRARERLG